MNQLVNLNQNNQTMTSLDFMQNIINPARESAGEKVVRNNVFLARIEDEIEDLGGYKTFVTEGGGTPQKYYDLNMDQMTLIGMRESKAVRRSVLATLKSLAHVPQVSTKFTPIQLLAQCVETIQEQMEIIKTVEDKNAKLTKTANAHINTTDLAKHLKQYCAKKSLVSRCNSTNVLQAAIDCGLLERTGKNEYKATELMLSEGFGATLGYSYPHWDMRVTNHLPFTMALSRIINK